MGRTMEGEHLTASLISGFPTNFQPFVGTASWECLVLPTVKPFMLSKPCWFLLYLSGATLDFGVGLLGEEVEIQQPNAADVRPKRTNPHEKINHVLSSSAPPALSWLVASALAGPD